MRLVYDTVYASSAYDGNKVAQFYRLYEQAGIVPTEVDYAFMVDRATQTSAPTTEKINAAAEAMKSLHPWIYRGFAGDDFHQSHPASGGCAKRL